MGVTVLPAPGRAASSARAVPVIPGDDPARRADETGATPNHPRGGWRIGARAMAAERAPVIASPHHPPTHLEAPT